MNELKVLIIDDEVVFSQNMAKLLNTRGYQTETANSGEEGIRVLEKEAYDVVVLDLKMPGMNGIETLKKINELDIQLQVILLTGHGCVDTAMIAIQLGAFDYLPKPCDVKELSEMIDNSQKNKNKKLKKSKRLRMRL
ncbi:MAG: response regulator [Desulfobacteraceae bacterium]|nr:response regulator [Desulfobacteraceae bacterium]MBC2756160.1 response regulator [Desulfobacteraceae bacterium]